MKTMVNALASAAVALGFAGHAALAVAGQANVGDTKDGCDADNVVHVTGKDGKVNIKANDTQYVDMSAPVREFEWHCGSSQEFSSNDFAWDRLRVHRAKNGAITFTFYRILPDPAAGMNTVFTKTGDTADGCDKSHLVTFQGRDGKATIKASQAQTVDLPGPVTELKYKCGADDGRVANDSLFDQVRVARVENGAITWVFYLKTAAADPAGVCDSVHAFGWFTYKDLKGAVHPLARVQVKLMDEDFGPTDHEMARGVTGPDGRFDLTGKGSDSGCVGAGCKRPDPYVEFVLFEDHRVDVKDPLENTARQKTKTRVNTCGDVDFGSQQWTAATSEPILFDNTQQAYDDFVRETKQTRVPGNDGVVGVEFPTVLIWDTPYTTWDTIHWPTQWNPIALGALPVVFSDNDMAQDFTAIFHEFGHRLRHAADGDREHFNWDMTRFKYARAHVFNDITNDGFAFNEGWAEYYRTVHSAVPMPNGTWGGPEQDNVEGAVANQLFNLAAKCGHFARMWDTMLGAGPDAFHSIDEYRAEFMKRNPLCGATIRKPPGGAAGMIPAPPGSGSKPMSAHFEPSPGDKASYRLARERLSPGVHAAVSGHVDTIDKRRAMTSRAPALRAPISMSVVSKAAIDSLNARRAALADAYHADVTAAYRKALDSMSGFTPDALADGTYDSARQAAIAGFGANVLDARVRLVQSLRIDLANAKARAEPKLKAYLVTVDAKYERTDVELKQRVAARAAPPIQVSELLPKSFWGTTVAVPK